MLICTHALHEYACEQRTATTCAMNFAHPSGCSSSGLKATPNRSNIGFQRYPKKCHVQRMVFETKMRWRIERDYQDLKQDLGLGHYEGRGWRGFHHHASLSIAAYGFLLAQRLQHPDEIGGKKNSAQRQESALPTHYRPRGSPPGAAPRPILHHQLADAHRRASGQKPPTLPVLLPPLGEAK